MNSNRQSYIHTEPLSPVMKIMNIYRIGTNRSPGPVFFRGLRCGGLYLRGVSIRDRALLIRKFSTVFKAPTMVCANKKKQVCTFNYIKKNHQFPTSCAKSSNCTCIGKEPVSSKITRLPGPSTYSVPGRFRVPRALFEREFYFLITINGWPSIREGLLFERVP